MPAFNLAFGGGKGGTGKSLLTVLFGILLAEIGYRVILIDADLQGANLHTFFGHEDPEVSLSSVFSQEKTPAQAVLPTGIRFLGLLHGFQQEWFPPPSPERILATASEIKKLDADILLWDVGSGSHLWPLLLFDQADAGLLISQPTHLGAERDLSFLRHLCRWRLRDHVDIQSITRRGWLPIPWLKSISRTLGPEKAHELQACLRSRPVFFLANGTHTREDHLLADEIFASSKRFLGIQGGSLGWLDHDERVWISVRKRRPILLEYPDSRWVEQLRSLLHTLLSFLALPPPRPTSPTPSTPPL